MDEAVRNFVNFTGARPDQAKYYLCKARGDLEVAAGYYFDEITSKVTIQEELAKPRPAKQINGIMEEEYMSNLETIDPHQRARQPPSTTRHLSQSRIVDIRDDENSEVDVESGLNTGMMSDISKPNAFDMIDQGSEP